MKRRKNLDCTPPPIRLLHFLLDLLSRLFKKNNDLHSIEQDELELKEMEMEENVLNSYEQQDELELEELEKEEKGNWDESDLV